MPRTSLGAWTFFEQRRSSALARGTLTTLGNGLMSGKHRRHPSILQWNGRRCSSTVGTVMTPQWLRRIVLLPGPSQLMFERRSSSYVPTTVFSTQTRVCWKSLSGGSCFSHDERRVALLRRTRRPSRTCWRSFRAQLWWHRPLPDLRFPNV